jgi:U4/U6.U5 tri-snRNP component SNU23
MSAYGKPAGDTDFRKTRNVEEYAKRATERTAAEREEAKARYEARLAGKKYYKPLDGSESLTSARAATLDLSSQVGKVQLVPAGAGVGKRGRSAGFYCEACDLTFKDNLQWVEHQNSMQHLRAVGQTGEVKRATAEDVRARIEAAWQRVQAAKDEATVTLSERLDIRKREDEKEREAKREKRKAMAEKKREAKVEDMKVDYGEDVRIEGEHDEDDMMAMMGIKGFGTTKG